MTKYDGPSYKKGQKSLRKGKVPNNRKEHSENGNNSLFERNQQLINHQPVKRNRGTQHHAPDALFADLMKQNDYERNRAFQKEQEPHSRSKKREVIDQRVEKQVKFKDSLKKPVTPYQMEQQSNTFRVKKVPSPYYGYNRFDEQKRSSADYYAAVKRLKKEPKDFLLFETYVSEYAKSIDTIPSKDQVEPREKQSVYSISNEVHYTGSDKKISKLNKENVPPFLTKKKRTLNRSLAGMIKEEQELKLNRKNTIPNYFDSNKKGLEKNTDKDVLNRKNEQTIKTSSADNGENEGAKIEIEAAVSRLDYLRGQQKKNSAESESAGLRKTAASDRHLSSDSAAASFNKEKDDLFLSVLPFLLREGQVSASSLQRKFKIGYNQATNLIDYLEKENIISGNKGSKPREVFLTRTEYEEKYL